MTGIARDRHSDDAAVALKAAGDRLRAIRTDAWFVEPITEQEYVARALEFSAWNGVDLEQLAKLDLLLQVGCRRVDRRRKALPPLPKASQLEKVRATISPTSQERAQFLRDMMRQRLAEILQGNSRWTFGRDPFGGQMVTVARGNDPAGCTLWMFLPRDLLAAVEHALLLVSDSKRSFRADLQKCELPNCGGYFLRTYNKKGGQPTKYHEDCRKRLRRKSRHIRRNSKENDK